MLLKRVPASIDPESLRSPDAFSPVFLRGLSGAGLSGPDPSFFLFFRLTAQRLLPAVRIPLIPGRNPGSAWQTASCGCMHVHGARTEGEAR